MTPRDLEFPKEEGPVTQPLFLREMAQEAPIVPQFYPRGAATVRAVRVRRRRGPNHGRGRRRRCARPAEAATRAADAPRDAPRAAGWEAARGAQNVAAHGPALR